MGSHTDPFDACQVVTAAGELDLTTVPAFARDLRAIRSTPEPPRLVVDFTDVSFLDGSVLDPLCDAWDRCRHEGGWARVVYTRCGVGILFRAAKVAELFPQHLTVRDALLGRCADAPRGGEGPVRPPRVGFSGIGGPP